MTETDPAQRFTLGTRTTLKAIILWASLPPLISPGGTFWSQARKAWNYNGPTHPPQHLGAFDHLLFPLPIASINQAFLASHSGRPASTGFRPCFAAYETTYVLSLRFCFTTPASGISSTSHTRMISHKRRGVCRYAIIVLAARSHNPL